MPGCCRLSCLPPLLTAKIGHPQLRYCGPQAGPPATHLGQKRLHLRSTWARLPKSMPVSDNRHWTFISFIGSDVIAYIFPILKKVGLAVVPYENIIYAGCEFRREAVPMRTDGLGISRISFVRGKVIPNVLITPEEICFAIG